MSVSQRRALMAAYKQELRTVDYDQITGEDLQAQISFYCSSGEYYSADDNYPVLKSFKKTIAVLEEMGLEIPQKLNADDISSVEVYGLVKSTAYENEDGSSYVEETTSGLIKKTSALLWKLSTMRTVPLQVMDSLSEDMIPIITVFMYPTKTIPDSL